MEITRFRDAKPYDAPKHTDVKSLRLQGLTGQPGCSLGYSYYLPGGRAAMDAGPKGKVYVVIEGELVVELGTGERQVLGPMDSCAITPGEAREIRNETNRIATLLVVIPD